jgi:uncharacterized protein
MTPPSADSDRSPTDRGSDFFRLGCLVEGGLLLAALTLGHWLGLPRLDDLRGGIPDAGLGLLASMPLFLIFLWLRRSSWTPLREIRRFLETSVRPLIGRWSIAQMAVISVLAGWGEEWFFRGLVQGELTVWTGPGPALALASVLFGLSHAVNRAYAVAAGLVGAYLGALWILSGSLLTPIIAHAAYDFGALFWFLRMDREPPVA